MTSYTEDEIRRAMKECPCWTVSAVLTSLKENQRDNHAHDWADTDTITVKEIRAAWARIQGLGEPGSVTASQFLRDISRHREPDYPVNTIWKDADGAIWHRIPDGKWGRLAQAGISPGDAPKRPLRQMGVS